MINNRLICQQAADVFTARHPEARHMFGPHGLTHDAMIEGDVEWPQWRWIWLLTDSHICLDLVMPVRGPTVRGHRRGSGTNQILGEPYLHDGPLTTNQVVDYLEQTLLNSVPNIIPPPLDVSVRLIS